jgi:hypothetical protein
MIASAIGLLLPGIAVWVMLAAVGPLRRPGSRMLAAAMALAGGIGLSSVTTFWAINLGARLGRGFVAADAAGWVLVAVLGWWYGRRSRTALARSLPTRPESRPRPTPLDWCARAVFALVAALAVATVVVHYQVSPYGEWDAWAIWNQKARFLLRGGDHWTQSLRIPWSNPSHPWLVSASVARLWAYAGEEVTVAPALLAAALATSVVLGVVGALSGRGAWAWVAGTVVMAPPAFMQLAAAQTADLPVGTFILLSTIALAQGVLRGDGPPRVLLLAGACGALAAWTKNEGGVFLLASALFASIVLVRRGQLTRMAWWVAGTAPVVLTLLWFKLAVAPDVPPYGADELQTFDVVMARLLSVQEHVTIGGTVGHLAPLWGGPLARGSLLVVLGAVAAGASAGASRTARFMLAVTGVMCAGYYATVVILPFDTTWLVSTTFERFFMQLWPSLVLAAFSWPAGEAAGDALDDPAGAGGAA